MSNDDVINLDDIFSDLGLGDQSDQNQGEGELTQQEKTWAGTRTKERHFERRVKSELALEASLPWHFEQGATYHCLSFGDVDALTYLRVIVKQQKIKYLVMATWCMAITDAEEIKKWLDAGYIERIDFYFGEIFNRKYLGVFKYLRDNCCRNGGRLCIFRNHSKVMAGFGERFDFSIASSANINTNPRCEQATITINREVALFYKNFYDEIRSYDKSFPDWEPVEIDK